jgi:hypothetical protein
LFLSDNELELEKLDFGTFGTFKKTNELLREFLTFSMERFSLFKMDFERKLKE